MKYDLQTSQAKLENGKTIHHITAWYPDNLNYYIRDIQLSQEERKEIAEYMVELWKEWAK